MNVSSKEGEKAGGRSAVRFGIIQLEDHSERSVPAE